MIEIRPECSSDIASIHSVNTAAFERDSEAHLVDQLRDHGSLTLSMVCVQDGQVVGHIAYSPVMVEFDDGGSLQALALQIDTARVFVATDARMGEVYHAAFARDADGMPALVGSVRCSAPLDVELPTGDWVAAGSAFQVWPEELGARHLGRLTGCRPEAVPRADEVARLAATAVTRGLLVPPERAAPLYVRDKVAMTTAERLARGGRA